LPFGSSRLEGSIAFPQNLKVLRARMMARSAGKEACKSGCGRTGCVNSERQASRCAAEVIRGTRGRGCRQTQLPAV
jgi:hypothetical protein